ncbi:TPA: DUF551 domain-containing protein [Escherichia coli]|nr:DUF551 domain-containing protein [Escherichia coli]
MALAAMKLALASLEAKPIGAFHISDQQVGGTTDYIKDGEWPIDDGVIEVYAAPPAPVVDADDNFYSWFGREWHEHYQQNQYTTAAKQMLGVMAESAWKAGRHAAMLQGAEPVTTAYKLPLDYLQGHKDGLEWASRLAEANHPQTGDWLYDDPLELAKAIRKGPDMPEIDGNSPVIPDCWVACSERMPTKQDGTVFLTWNSQYIGKELFLMGSFQCLKPEIITHWMPLPAAPQQEVNP